IDSLTELFASGAVTAVTDLITLVGIVAFMLAIDWQLSLVAFCALPPLALAVRYFRRFARDAYRSIRRRIAELNAYLAEQVQGVRVVQAYGREGDCAEEYSAINSAYRDANFRSIRYDALLYSVVQSVSVACVALVLYFAAIRAGWMRSDASALWVGTVVAFYDYIQRFFIPIRDLATKYTIIQSSLASAERVFTLLDTDEPDAPACEVDAPSVSEGTAIAFKDVTFGYREGHDVLHEVNLEVREGERIAIVGATGSGKTTLTSLLLRLYELRQGHIVVQGDEVRTLDRQTLRKRFAVVPQDVFLFTGTLRENLAVGDASPDDARIQEALARVGATELVARRGGLDAEVHERGINFSAGERQLLAFARALYREAQLLLLDEATANVDSDTEAALQVAAEEVMKGRTALIIAHRLSTIERADRIVVLHRGRIVEEGPHAELLARGGVYARLHRLQTASHRESNPDLLPRISEMPSMP
ncbi:MAG: ABC transporter ATP-binding protein, partial [Myxococcota bacterium]